MNEKEYPIVAENGALFCKCKRVGDDIMLIAKKATLSLAKLQEQAFNPGIYQKTRGKRNGMK